MPLPSLLQELLHPQKRIQDKLRQVVPASQLEQEVARLLNEFTEKTKKGQRFDNEAREPLLSIFEENPEYFITVLCSPHLITRRSMLIAILFDKNSDWMVPKTRQKVKELYQNLHTLFMNSADLSSIIPDGREIFRELIPFFSHEDGKEEVTHLIDTYISHIDPGLFNQIQSEIIRKCSHRPRILEELLCETTLELEEKQFLISIIMESPQIENHPKLREALRAFEVRSTHFAQRHQDQFLPQSDNAKMITYLYEQLQKETR